MIVIFFRLPKQKWKFSSFIKIVPKFRLFEFSRFFFFFFYYLNSRFLNFPQFFFVISVPDFFFSIPDILICADCFPQFPIFFNLDFFILIPKITFFNTDAPGLFLSSQLRPTCNFCIQNVFNDGYRSLSNANFPFFHKCLRTFASIYAKRIIPPHHSKEALIVADLRLRTHESSARLITWLISVLISEFMVKCYNGFARRMILETPQKNTDLGPRLGPCFSVSQSNKYAIKRNSN